MKRLEVFIIYAVVIASLLINLFYLYSQSIRLDEAQSIWVATKSVPTLLKINGQDVQTPLYTLILHFWMQILGTDIVISRLLSLIFFILTLPFLYFLIKRVTNRATAILGTALFALSPFVLWYSQEARTYTLLTLLATVNHYYFLQIVDSKGEKGRWGYFITGLLGIYSHYFFAFMLLSQAIYLLIKKFESSRQLTITFILLGACMVNLFLPWAYYVYTLGLAANTQPIIPQPNSFNLLQIYFNFFIGFQNQLIQSIVISLWPLFLMIIFFIFTRQVTVKLQRTDYFVVISILPVLLIYLFSFFKPIFLPRYLIFVTPSLFTLLAWILINFGRQVISIVSVVIIALMLLSLNFQDTSAMTPVKESYREVDKYLVTHATPHDIIAVSAPFTVYPIEYYYGGLARIDTIPHWNRYVQGPIPPFTTNELVSQLKDYAKVYDNIYLVLSYDQGYQGKIVDYMDHHYQRLKSMEFPASIDIRVYKLRYD
ncbi:glycosyltransferase family 39 protein [Patescibacteria group bacterium]|nr:glycosyltransferase family 39 protein [Patescibacteria group bacterium]